MEKGLREFLAFILNFVWPGLGFLFSGFIHNLRTLRLIGFGVIVIFLLLSLNALRNLSFDVSDLFISVLIGLIFGLLGAAVERQCE